MGIGSCWFHPLNPRHFSEREPDASARLLEYGPCTSPWRKCCPCDVRSCVVCTDICSNHCSPERMACSVYMPQHSFTLRSRTLQVCHIDLVRLSGELVHRVMAKADQSNEQVTPRGRPNEVLNQAETSWKRQNNRSVHGYGKPQ